MKNNLTKKFFLICIVLFLLVFSLETIFAACSPGFSPGDCRVICGWVAGPRTWTNCTYGGRQVECYDVHKACGSQNGHILRDVTTGSTGTSCTNQACTSLTDNPNPTIGLTGCYASLSQQFNLNGNSYSLFADPSAKIRVNGIGHQNNDSDFKDFFILNLTKIDPLGSTRQFSNSLNAANSLGTGKNICTGRVNGCTTAGGEIGRGITEFIAYDFNYPSDLGGHNYVLKKINKPSANSMTHLSGGSTIDVVNSNNNVYVGLPGLIVNGPTDVNSGFYEKFGRYERRVLFNLINTSPLDLNLMSYSLNCLGGNGVSCTISSSWTNFEINSFGKMVIYGTITLDKNYLPKNPIQVVLDVNYKVKNFDSNPNCQNFYNTSSPPVNLRYGLLDYQKFQVGLISSRDFNGCIGENGMIGRTGERVAPRINIGFGGSATDGLISIDECDTYDINGNVNPTWVYCSRKEFIIELARKIGKVWEIQQDINRELLVANTNHTRIFNLELEKQKYLTFETNIRRQSFTKSELNQIITDLFSNVTLWDSLGLDGVYGSSVNRVNQKEKVESLLNQIRFTQLGGDIMGELQAGTYNVTMSIQTIGIQNNYELFNDNTLNPNIEITINFSNTLRTPEINWFFYEFEDDDFSELTPNILKTFENTNLSNRGELLKYVYNGETSDFNNSNYLFSPSYAVPLFVRLKTGTTFSDINKTFNLSQSVGSNNKFSYWTGFASSIEDGCVNIVTKTNSLNSLPYREADSKIGNTNQNFYFSQFDTGEVKQNQTIYLQTVLFWPSGITNNLNLSAPFSIYTKTGQNNQGTVNVSSINPEFNVVDLNSLFNRIKEEKVCIHYGPTGTRSTGWTLFWNTKSIYDSIEERKSNILTTNNDAKICELREILGS
jgi:hypothetical protein